MEGKQEANEKMEGKRDYKNSCRSLVSSTSKSDLASLWSLPGHKHYNSSSLSRQFQSKFEKKNTPILDPAHAIPWIIKHLDEMKFLFSNASLSCQRNFSALFFLPGEMGPRTASLLCHRSCIVVESWLRWGNGQESSWSNLESSWSDPGSGKI